SQGEKSRRHPKDTIRRLWIHQLFRVRRQQRRRVHNKVTRQQRAKAAGYVAPSPLDAASNCKARKKLTKQVVRSNFLPGERTPSVARQLFRDDTSKCLQLTDHVLSNAFTFWLAEQPGKSSAFQNGGPKITDEIRRIRNCRVG